MRRGQYQGFASGAAAAVPLLALLLGLGVLLGACGTADSVSDTPSTTQSVPESPPAGSTSPSDPAADLPACQDVWKKGAKLPRSYAGCQDAGEVVARDALGCSSGQKMVRYDDRFWAVLGGEIHRADSSLNADPDYRDSVASCRG